MKKIIFTLILINTGFLVRAQNTFPATGNVGVGTESPSSKLTIQGTNAWGGGLRINNGSYKWDVAADANGDRFYIGKNASSMPLVILGSTGNVGVGTESPSSKLTIQGTNAWGGGLRINNGSYKWDVAADANGDRFYIGTNASSMPFVISGSTGNVGIGTTNSEDWKLAVNGKIRAKEIKVETGWSDFVFETDYTLPTLSEVENHIKEKGHLKDIPNAKEVEKNGILLGAMNAKLLQKIEELTLYTIQQEKEIKQQANEIEELKSLSNRLSEIEKLIEAKK
ncbi:hypothetical protein [Aquimarina megaterium]|uniref:hypothetical protein n=1 Tax=Aquimarina megaterium TaxID=1443666 RepID=UPI00094552FE|nr:hypothetical protein [Aquimarina megaterium]